MRIERRWIDLALVPFIGVLLVAVYQRRWDVSVAMVTTYFVLVCFAAVVGEIEQVRKQGRGRDS